MRAGMRARRMRLFSRRVCGARMQRYLSRRTRLDTTYARVLASHGERRAACAACAAGDCACLWEACGGQGLEGWVGQEEGDCVRDEGAGGGGPRQTELVRPGFISVSHG